MASLGGYRRSFAVDFWGFGKSGKKRKSFFVQDFVSLVDQFMMLDGPDPSMHTLKDFLNKGKPNA